MKETIPSGERRSKMADFISENGELSAFFMEDAIRQLEEKMTSLFGETDFSFANCFSMLMEGNLKGCLGALAGGMKKMGISQMEAGQELILTVLFLGILGSVFQIFSDSLEKKTDFENGTIYFCLAFCDGTA